MCVCVHFMCLSVYGVTLYVYVCESIYVYVSLLRVLCVSVPVNVCVVPLPHVCMSGRSLETQRGRGGLWVSQIQKTT